MKATSEMEIIGLRGAAGHGPENTATAIAAGLKAGATAIELDVQFTRDGVPVVFHDQSLEKAAGVRGAIRDQTARELSGYDIGFRRGNPHRGLRLLTLEEAAMQVPSDVDIHLVMADYDTVTPKHLKEMVDIVRRRGGMARALFGSSSSKTLGALRSVDGRSRLALHTTGQASGWMKDAADLGCEAILADASQLSSTDVEKGREAGIRILAYGADEPKLIRKLIEMGVNGMCSSFPDRVREITGPVRPRAASHRQARQVSRPSQAPAGTPGPGAAAAPAVETAEPGAEGARTRKRRRGRRGGRKVRARRGGENAAPGEKDAALSEPADLPLEIPAIEPDSDSELEIASAPPAEESERPAEAAAVKKRRRGHRGGKRHRLRRLRKMGAAPSEAAAEPGPEPEPDSEPEQG